jgi:hypothetical protein
MKQEAGKISGFAKIAESAGFGGFFIPAPEGTQITLIVLIKLDFLQ